MKITIRYTPNEVLNILECSICDPVSGLTSFVATRLQALDDNEEELEVDSFEVTLEVNVAQSDVPLESTEAVLPNRAAQLDAALQQQQAQAELAQAKTAAALSRLTEFQTLLRRYLNKRDSGGSV